MSCIKKIKKVVILGAGITGLSVAHTLSSNDLNVSIVEKDKKVGGIIKGFKVGQYTFDHGPHAILTRNKAAFDQFRELIKDNLINIGDRKGGIYFRGKYYEYPLKPSAIFKHTSPILSAKMLLSFLYYNAKKLILRPKEKSFEEYVKNTFGKELYNRFFKDYTKKVWGVEPSTLAASFAAERIPKLSLFRLLKGIFSTKKPKTKKIRFSEDNLYYPKNGIGQIAELFEKAINKNNGTIYLNSRVNKINIDDQKVKSVEFIKNGKKEVIYADYFVSTIPITDMVADLSPPPSKKILNAARNLKYNRIKFLFLVVNKERVLKDKWVYFHDDNDVFYRMFDTGFFSKSLMPKGKTGLITELSTRHHKTNEEFFKAAVRDLEKYGLSRKDEIESYFFDDLEHGYPVYTIDYKKNLDLIFGELSKIKNFQSIGRQGLFRYLDMDHCIRFGPIILDIIKGKKDANTMDQIVAQHGKKTF